MPNPYVVPSKDVQIYLTFEGLPAIKIGTGTSLNLQYSQTVQDIFAIGETDPIDLVQLNAQYAATLSHQTGEQHTILPGTLHWFRAGNAGAVISEFSTHSTDETDFFTDGDVVREARIEE